jgi:hypothetical protein
MYYPWAYQRHTEREVLNLALLGHFLSLYKLSDYAKHTFRLYNYASSLNYV